MYPVSKNTTKSFCFGYYFGQKCIQKTPSSPPITPLSPTLINMLLRSRFRLRDLQCSPNFLFFSDKTSDCFTLKHYYTWVAELHWGEYTESVFFREYPFVKLLLLYLVEYDLLQLKIRMGHNLLFWASLLSRPFYMHSKFPKYCNNKNRH